MAEVSRTNPTSGGYAAEPSGQKDKRTDEQQEVRQRRHKLLREATRSSIDNPDMNDLAHRRTLGRLATRPQQREVSLEDVWATINSARQEEASASPDALSARIGKRAKKPQCCTIL